MAITEYSNVKIRSSSLCVAVELSDIAAQTCMLCNPSKSISHVLNISRLCNIEVRAVSLERADSGARELPSPLFSLQVSLFSPQLSHRPLSALQLELHRGAPGFSPPHRAGGVPSSSVSFRLSGLRPPCSAYRASGAATPPSTDDMRILR